MLLGTVEGNIWSTKKSPGLLGKSFLTVRVGQQLLICADCVGAGEGETGNGGGERGRRWALPRPAGLCPDPLKNLRFLRISQLPPAGLRGLRGDGARGGRRGYLAWPSQ